MGFEQALGLWSLAALVPFIILYLIKPKPVEKVIPSLMFLMKDEKVSRQNAFLRRLLRNFLFFIQLLALLGIAFSIAQPYITLPYKASAEHTVLVIDASASMQTKSGSGTRFTQALTEAKNYLDGSISIVLAENTPVVLLHDGSRSAASTILNTLQPKATTSNVGDAMIVANDLLNEKKGRIVVFSDFLTTEGPDVLVTKRTLTAQDQLVEFVDVVNEAKNYGIVDALITKTTTKLSIKSFSGEDIQTTLRVKKGNDVLDTQTFTLLPHSFETFAFDTPAGLSTVELSEKDDLVLDNVLHISGPTKTEIKVLLITNNDKANYAKSALLSIPGMKLDIAEPPIVPSIKHDIVVFYEVAKEHLLPGTWQDINNFVNRGGKLVVASQENIGVFNTRDLLPINPTGNGEVTEVLITQINALTEDLEIGFVNKYVTGTAKEDTLVLAQATDESPLLAQRGNVFYLGVLDHYSDFKSSPSYPIFWNQMIGMLSESEHIADFNFKAGKIMPLSEQLVKTPSGSVTTSRLLLDEVGVYEVGNKKIAVNVLDMQESDVSNEKKFLSKRKEGLEVSFTDNLAKFQLANILLLGIFLLLVYELYYLKTRGDF